MSKPLKKILKSARSDNGSVFCNNGKKLNADGVSRSFKKCVRKTDLNDRIHFHTLRHSFASAIIQKGGSLYAVKELLGHSSIQTTESYSHLSREDLVKAINELK